MNRPVFNSPAERIMVAVDVSTMEEARAIAEAVSGLGVTLKIGNQLGTYAGWQAAIELAKEFNVKVFCDTKFKDIPETVKQSARSITKLGPNFFNIMADTQGEALRGAVEGTRSAAAEIGIDPPILLGVSVLTSFTNEDSHRVYGTDSATKVQQFATIAAGAGLDGMVCSAEEAEMLRIDPMTRDLILVTPGIRPVWASPNDQARITTPAQAIAMGADYLVIGRPITQPPEEIGTPRDAVLTIIKELEGAA